jgi:DNA-binding NtrC family response regulator
MVTEGRFRDDLYYRLNVITLSLPSLRERREDVPLLVEHFIQKYCQENGRPTRRFTPEALQLLVDHSWPGNVRELENTIERAVVLSSAEEMGATLLPDEIARPHLLSDPSMKERSLFDIVEDYERRIILDALDRSGGSQTEAAPRPKPPSSSRFRFPPSIRRSSAWVSRCAATLTAKTLPVPATAVASLITTDGRPVKEPAW